MQISKIFIIITVLLPLLLFAFKKADHAFWFSLMLYFDPGGFFSGYFGGNIFWRVKFYDVFFFILVLIFINRNKKGFFHIRNREFTLILTYLILISLYFLLATGILVPMVNNYINFPFFVQKNRQFFYAVPIFIMVYFFSYRSIHIFYRLLVWFSVIILTAYFVTLFTGFKLIPVLIFSRFEENDRIGMISYGLIYWVLIIGLVYLFAGKRFKPHLSKALIYSALLMSITLILTLTRREFLRIIFMLLAVPLIISGITRSSLIIKIQKITIPLFTAILIIYLLFPAYIGKSLSLLSDTYSIITTGNTLAGVEEYRVTGSGDMLFVKEIIRQNPILGMGFYPAQWSDILEMQFSGDKLGFALDASSEVPVYGAIMRLGLLGLILPTLLYFALIKTSWRIFLFLKKNHDNLFVISLDFILIVSILYFVLAKFTVEIYGLFGEFYSPYQFPVFCLILGMLFGIFKRIKQKIID